MTRPCRPPTLSRRAWLRSLLAGGLALPLAEAAPAQSEPRAASLLAALAGATTIRQGDGSHSLYVFFDPNCPYCHHLYLELQPLVAGGGLQVHWVVLGMLTASSLPKAAAILQAPDRLKAFETNEHDYDFAANGQPGGGIEPARTIEPATRRLLQRNLDIYRGQRLFGVPVMAWKTRGGQARMFIGVPSRSQLRGWVADLA